MECLSLKQTVALVLCVSLGALCWVGLYLDDKIDRLTHQCVIAAEVDLATQAASQAVILDLARVVVVIKGDVDTISRDLATSQSKLANLKVDVATLEVSIEKIPETDADRLIDLLDEIRGDESWDWFEDILDDISDIKKDIRNIEDDIEDIEDDIGELD